MSDSAEKRISTDMIWVQLNPVDYYDAKSQS